MHIVDQDERSQTLAAELGAGVSGAPTEDPDVVLTAVPPSQVGLVTIKQHRKYLKSIFTDVSSVKTNVEVEMQRIGLSDRFVGGHPMAGRERSGPEAARADLFDGRPWVLCPTSEVAEASVAAVVELVLACGARPVQMSAQTHDEAVAIVSHGPQLVASALAAQLVAADDDELELAGQGLRDSVRIAASDPDLWVDIVAANASALTSVLQGVVDDLGGAISALQEISAAQDGPSDKSINGQSGKQTLAARERLRALVAQGRAGHARIPGKHGARAVAYAIVPVVVPDEPGALARLLVSAGEAGVNVEDISIEHSPGQPVGLVELSVTPAAAPSLAAALAAMGWSVH